MTKITIDNIEYDVDSLSEEAKAQLVSIQWVDAEIIRLQQQAAVLQTARISYSTELNKLLPQGDTIKFN
ncbi:hypothetical protein [Flavobacterium sp.]|uniref:hypothetical protein n=1 Tax=Flavobacterium sp. TaxID=239 RepID=UPI0037C18441